MVMNALRNVQEELGTTVIIVTHDMEVASQMNRLVSLVDGKIADDARSNARMTAVQILRDKRESGEITSFAMPR